MEDKPKKTEEKDLDLIVLGDGERICFFDFHNYKLGDLVCPTVNGRDAVYVIYMTANTDSPKKSYYAELL
jgi:hypothetical protein